MNAVAERVGVRAPSLYKRVEGRDRLVQLVAEATLRDLAERLDAQQQEVVAALRVFRDFGHERPAAFQLVMTPGVGVPTAGGGVQRRREPDRAAHRL